MGVFVLAALRILKNLFYTIHPVTQPPEIPTDPAKLGVSSVVEFSVRAILIWMIYLELD